MSDAISVKGVRALGLSRSGLTIRGAAQALRGVYNSKVIVNVGSEDLLLDRPLIDMQEDFHGLLKVCEVNNVQVVITTLAPIANQHHIPATVKKWKRFNTFLMGFSLAYTVIDLVPCMVQPHKGTVIFECYKRY